MSSQIKTMTAHRLKADLKQARFTQLDIAMLIDRSPAYVFQKLRGFAPFTPAEEVKLEAALASVTARPAKLKAVV